MHNILFICALPEEKQALVKTLGQRHQQHIINPALTLTLDQYKTDLLNIYVCQSGMGSVNAAMNLSLVLAQFTIHQIVLLGVGGALHTRLEIGDMIMSDQVIVHDYYASLDTGNYLMRPGDLILSADQAVDYNPIIKSHNSPFLLPSLEQQSIKVITALIASGSEFVGTAQRKNKIHQQCQNALLVDMEAAGVAVVAKQFEVPFLIAKTVSDKLNSDESIGQDFTTFLACASLNAATIAQLIIRSIEEQLSC